MRKTGLLLASALGLVAFAAPAQAVSFNYAQGVTATATNATIIQNFDDITPGGVTYTPGETIGNNTNIYNTDVTNMGATPNGSSGNYAAVLGGGTYTLQLAAAVPVVSFLLGSLDPGNYVTLTLTNGTTTTSQTYTGTDIGATNSSGRLTFDTGSATDLISAITFGSSTNSFEIDNIASAAPEAATWMMMILGFGIVGGALRSRRQATLTAA